MKRFAIVGMLVALAACKGVGLGSLDTYDHDHPNYIGPGISNLNTEDEEDKKEQKWFDGFYSGKHGWGWGGDKDDNCSFYGTCAKTNGPL